MAGLDPRAILLREAAARGESLTALSLMLRRNAAYLHQFVHRGSPRRLAEDDRRLLADHFGIDEYLLGAAPSANERDVDVPLLDVTASAGPGAAADSERMVRSVPLAAGLLRSLGIARGDASIVTARGTSMAPGIIDGDRLLVDRAARRLSARGVICVARVDGDLLVKRASRQAGAVHLVSDNPAIAPLRRAADTVEVIGRVRLLLREPR